MKNLANSFVVASLALSVSGCSFSPSVANREGGSAVSIALTANRAGKTSDLSNGYSLATNLGSGNFVVAKRISNGTASNCNRVSIAVSNSGERGLFSFGISRNSSYVGNGPVGNGVVGNGLVGNGSFCPP